MDKNYTRVALFVAVLLALPTSALAIDVTATDLASDLTDAVLGAGLTPLVTGATLSRPTGGSGVDPTGANSSVGTFTDGTTGGVTPEVGFDSGILLSTGVAVDVEDTGASTAFGLLGGGPLSALPGLLGSGETLWDLTTLSIDFTTVGDGEISMDFTFGSEERTFLDVFRFLDPFAVFLDGVAQSIGGGLWVDPTDTNETGLSAFIGFDDISGIFNLVFDVLGAGDHTLTLAIADMNDPQIDSGVFIGSIDYTATGDPIPEPATMALLGTGLLSMAGALRRKKNS